MQTRLFGIILAGHIEKSSGFCIPAKQEMLSTGRASQLPLHSLCLKRKKFIHPLLLGSICKISARADTQQQIPAERQSIAVERARTSRSAHPRRLMMPTEGSSGIAGSRPETWATWSSRQQLVLPGDESHESGSSIRDSPSASQVRGDSWKCSRLKGRRSRFHLKNMDIVFT